MDETVQWHETGRVRRTGPDPDERPGQGAISMTLAVGEYDRTQALLDGRVRPAGIDLKTESGDIGKFCKRPVYEEYDAAEMSLSWYLMARSRREPVIALPIFPLRMLVHAYLFCRSDAPYRSPKDLVGRRLGMQRYRWTVNLWLRGILKDHYGVAPEDFSWVTTEEEGAGFVVPPELSLTRLSGRDPEDLLMKGEIDALLSPVVPRLFRSGDPRIRRLFPDCQAEVESYFRQTGIFPITHTVVMSEALWKRVPWVAEKLINAFRDAQRRCEEFYLTDPKHLTLPRAVLILEEERALFGADPWVHGLPPNRHVLDTFVRYAHEQGYIPRRPALEEIFAENTLSM